MERMIDVKEIEKLAELSRIEVSEEEKKELAKDFESILEYVSQINETVSAEEKKTVGELYNVMREDDKPHEGGIYTKELVKAFPKSERNYLKVKKIIDQG